MKTEAEEKLERITNEIKCLRDKDRLKADVAYTHLTSIIKWLIATIVIMFITMFGCVVWFLNTFDITTETIEIDAGTGNANYVEGEANTINYG